MRKFEEYEAGYESYRIITSLVLREIRLSVKVAKWLISCEDDHKVEKPQSEDQTAKDPAVIKATRRSSSSS